MLKGSCSCEFLKVGFESQWVPKPAHYVQRRYSPRVSDQLFCIALVSCATVRRALIAQHGSKGIISNSSGIIVWFDAFAALTFTLRVQRMK
jgi:hypothetical protein